MGRIAKHALAFFIGLIAIGGVLYWVSADSFSKGSLKSESLVEIHWTEANCNGDKECQTTEYLDVAGNFSGDANIKLSKADMQQLQLLIDKANFSSLPLLSNPNCPSLRGGKDLSFSFPTIADPTWYAPCAYKNNSSELFTFLMQKLHLT